MNRERFLFPTLTGTDRATAERILTSEGDRATSDEEFLVARWRILGYDVMELDRAVRIVAGELSLPKSPLIAGVVRHAAVAASRGEWESFLLGICVGRRENGSGELVWSLDKILTGGGDIDDWYRAGKAIVWLSSCGY